MSAIKYHRHLLAFYPLWRHVVLRHVVCHQLKGFHLVWIVHCRVHWLWRAKHSWTLNLNSLTNLWVEFSLDSRAEFQKSCCQCLCIKTWMVWIDLSVMDITESLDIQWIHSSFLCSNPSLESTEKTREAAAVTLTTTVTAEFISFN